MMRALSCAAVGAGHRMGCTKGLVVAAAAGSSRAGSEDWIHGCGASKALSGAGHESIGTRASVKIVQTIALSPS
jgi:hypothetical protein